MARLWLECVDCTNDFPATSDDRTRCRDCEALKPGTMTAAEGERIARRLAPGAFVERDEADDGPAERLFRFLGEIGALHCGELPGMPRATLEKVAAAAMVMEAADARRHSLRTAVSREAYRKSRSAIYDKMHANSVARWDARELVGSLAREAVGLSDG